MTLLATQKEVRAMTGSAVDNGRTPCWIRRLPMSLTTRAEQDGRLHRATKAMRRIVSMRFSLDEVIELFTRVKARRAAEALEFDNELPDTANRDERRRAGQEAIGMLDALGYSGGDIADFAGVSPTTITRARGRNETRVLKA